jgi:hypothetical protein
MKKQPPWLGFLSSPGGPDGNHMFLVRMRAASLLPLSFGSSFS